MSTTGPTESTSGMSSTSEVSYPVVARAGRYYRNARYLMVALCIGMGGYFLYDGYVGYPKENREEMAKPENKDAYKDGQYIGKLPHSETDIQLQKLLGFALIPAAGLYFAYFMHKSRGAYQFDGQTIEIPGHPPFTLGEITKLDKKLWDRKGIAYIEYKTADGKQGRALLDDFIYERKPTDVIYEAVNAEMKAR